MLEYCVRRGNHHTEVFSLVPLNKTADCAAYGTNHMLVLCAYPQEPRLVTATGTRGAHSYSNSVKTRPLASEASFYLKLFSDVAESGLHLIKKGI